MNGAPGKSSPIRSFLRSNRGRIVIALILIVAIQFCLIFQIVNSHRREQRIVQQIRALRGTVQLRSLVPSWFFKVFRWQPPQFNRVDCISLPQSAISTELLQSIASLSYLAGLDARRARLTYDGVKQLPRMTKLRLLDLDDPRIGDVELELLGRMKSLEYLHLSDTQVSDAGLKHLRGLTNLRYLKLNHTGVTDDGLKQLKELPMLEGIELINTNITDAGLDELIGIANLNTLLIDRTNVSGAGLSKLKSFSSLRYLWVDEKKTSAEARMELKEALPNCRIRYGP